MKKIMLSLISAALIIFSSVPAFAGKYSNSNGYTQDTYGSWERSDNAYKDSDGDGVVNHYDSNNRNSSVW